MPVISSQTALIGHNSAVYALANGLLDQGFLSAGGDGLVVQWDLNAPEHGVVQARIGDAIFSLLQDPKRKMLLIGTGAGRLVLVDLETRAEVQVVELHTKGIFRILAYTDDHFLCAGGDGMLSTWAWRSGETSETRYGIELMRQIPLCDEKLRDIALAPARDNVAVACGDGTIRLLETALFNELERFGGHENGCTSVAFHPKKPVLLSGGKDGNLKVWRMDGTGRNLHTLAAHKGAVYATTLDDRGRWIATVGRDSLVKIWDAHSLQPLFRSVRGRDGHTHSVNAAIWRGDSLLTASDDRTIRSWEMSSKPSLGMASDLMPNA